MLILGASATVNDLTGMNVIAACFLIPVGRAPLQDITRQLVIALAAPSMLMTRSASPFTSWPAECELPLLRVGYLWSHVPWTTG